MSQEAAWLTTLELKLDEKVLLVKDDLTEGAGTLVEWEKFLCVGVKAPKAQ